MKYLIKEENRVHMYQVFKYLKYEIPLQEIMLIKKHNKESVIYALYNEEGKVYLLTDISVMNECVYGNGGFAKPYCKIEEIDDYSLKTLDSDAYNWYMTHAK
ncbi:hypothetical protein [Planococcus shenhongbingii]|uniref:Uncharacterized protein n=1 Tax=Planococcus shenhongbingii TaxID=3058398 RepID=A0ABT8NE07_9BACL|nr:hypothetical protein [Planococcus sp. N017]MDN7246134.1 hypothetical protein [Planococcus sp. N017]